MNRRIAIPALAVALIGALGLFVASRTEADDAQCGPGFVAKGPRCFARDPSHHSDRAIVAIPETTISIGPSDWEAEGRVSSRAIHVNAFSIDAFEVSEAEAALHLHRATPGMNEDVPASAVTREEASRVCAARGGRLPTEDEWIVAAAGDPPKRYPWGDTGAVCRRAAWGLETGPCSKKGTGPDTVGAHAEGDSPRGIHDLAGNVAEWVDSGPSGPGVVRGGSWKSALVTELRTWARVELDPSTKDPSVGFRCAYAR